MAEPESKTETDLRGRPLPKDRPGPKKSRTSNTITFSFKISVERLNHLKRCAQYHGENESEYLRRLVWDDWRRYGHLTAPAPPRKYKPRRRHKG